jgi:hypothetical protein
MSDTPASSKHMPDGPAPDGRNAKIMDGESANCSEAWDGKKEVMPLVAQDYLKDAAGQS